MSVIVAMLRKGMYLIVFCGAVAGCSPAQDMGDAPAISAKQQSPSAEQIEDSPLTISLDIFGNWANWTTEFSWHLSINSAGQAVMTIFDDANTQKFFQATNEQIDSLRQALIDGRFFDLKGKYGNHYPDGIEQSLTVTAGPYSKTVMLLEIPDPSLAEHSELSELRTIVRIIAMLRELFDEPRAVDIREHNQGLLDSIKVDGDD